MRDSAKQYFSQRQGRGPKAELLPFESFRAFVVGIFDRFRARGYMQEAFGIECVDGYIPGALGANPDDYFMRAAMRPRIWPYWTPVEVREIPVVGAHEGWDADCLFDVVEVLHDLVSKPTNGHYHHLSGCGWHHSEFDRDAGRSEFRDELNGVLCMHDPPYEINDDGLIVEAAPAALNPLLSAGIPPGIEAEIVNKLNGAVTRFRTRGASIDDRRHVVRDLADILEALRNGVREAMMSSDERALFQIANGFAIRHHNREQRGDYDRETWLRWTFYVYLATIHAVLRVLARAGEMPPAPDG